MFKKRGLVCLVSIFALVFSVSLVSAQTEGIPLQKDVFLGAPILGPEDLPGEITFTLFDAQDALIPLGSQTFTRGQYTVDFEFSQSDGITGGNAARIKANFTQPLNLVDTFGEPLKPKALWSALEVAGAEVGPRTKVSDETMVQLLLNSNASMATYLTLAYEGDDNPLTTIYKSLPLSFSSSDGTTTSLSNYFSSLPEERIFGAVNWVDSGANVYITSGNVGIGTTTPANKLHVTGWSQFDAGIVGSTANGFLRLYGDIGSSKPLYIKDNGWVGMGGVTNPGSPVHIANSGTCAIRLQDTLNSTATTYGSDLYGAYFWADGAKAFRVYTNSSERMRVTATGFVGIGTTNPGYELTVNGTIRAKQIIVDTGWSDFVFDDNYRLPQLNEVEEFVKEHKHLPGIPSEAEVKEKGVSLGNISSKLLQKIEELTLYVIDIKKENDSLKAQLVNLEAQMKETKN